MVTRMVIQEVNVDMVHLNLCCSDNGEANLCVANSNEMCVILASLN